MWWDDLIHDQAGRVRADLGRRRASAVHPLHVRVHRQAEGRAAFQRGYLLQAMLTMQWTFDYKPTDVFWCTADVGWVTGHTYIAYGPLAVGATEIVFEGVPTYPDAGRFWKMIQDHKVTIFYTAPTAIRSLIKAGEDLPKQYDLSSLRLLGTRGRADQSGSLDVVPHNSGRQPLPDRGHLVADRDRRPHDYAAAGRRRRSSPAPARCRCRASSPTSSTRPATRWRRAKAASS